MSAAGGDNEGARVSAWLALFAVAYAIMDILPSFLTQDIRHKLTTGDVFNFFTPFVLLPLVWRLYHLLRDRAATVGLRRLAAWIFFISAILFVDGHGMNLSANAVARHLVNQKGQGVYLLDYFFDETMGHIFAHTASLGMAAALLVLVRGTASVRPTWLAWAAAPLFGFAYFADGVEGQTVPILLPGAIAVVLVAAVMVRNEARVSGRHPVVAFLLAAYVVALILFGIWYVWQGGFPQFSELGWV